MKLKRFFILILACLFLLTLVTYTYYSYEKKTKAITSDVVVDRKDLKEERLYSSKNGVKKFSLYALKNNSLSYLAKTNSNLGIQSFSGKTVKLRNGNQLTTFLPQEIINQLILTEKVKDNQNKSYLARGFTSNQEHFFYQQQINNLPVYGAHLSLHLDGDYVFGFDGNIITNSTVPQSVVGLEEAQSIALTKAVTETNHLISLSVFQSQKYILNKKILGISDDDNNYLVLVVWIKNEEQEKSLFSKKYFVDLLTGGIIYEETVLIQVLDRQVYDYTFNKARKEGQPATGDQAIDTTYDILGTGYNFYFNSFNRDSYDNKGSSLIATVHLKDKSCPNAFSIPLQGNMYFCDGMYTGDIIGHELGHLVNGHSVNGGKLIYQGQSGALDESLADIFAYGVDSSNWTLGEGSVLGVLRRYDDPSAKGQPDRLFSDLYYCGNGDYGGIHKNSGLLNKAFYLMVTGGSFNSCTMQALGKEKTFQIIYRALTTYLTPTTNFRDIYDSLLRACGDLYQNNSQDCFNVKQALQAVEIDQQPTGTQTGAKCSNIERQTPACVSAPLTITPSTTITLSPTPSTVIQPTIFPLPTVPITPSGNVEINLKLKFQGIQKKPNDLINKLYVRITLVSDKGVTEQSHGIFSADENGIWSGKAYFNLGLGFDNAKYKILVKGPMHIQKRICGSLPTEEKDGYYQCQTPNITVKNGVNSFDFSKIMLLAGDLPIQDGIVNSYDLSLIRQRLGVTVGPQMYDLNMDGIINTQDYSLVIYSLSMRFDE